MEQNKENSEEVEQNAAKEEGGISDFVDLVNAIAYYYYYSNGDVELDEGDEWKRNAGLSKNKKNVPEKVDKLVEKAFCVQLKKFI